MLKDSELSKQQKIRKRDTVTKIPKVHAYIADCLRRRGGKLPVKHSLRERAFWDFLRSEIKFAEKQLKKLDQKLLIP